MSLGQTKKLAFESQRGFLPAFQYSYHFPGGDMRKRFGQNSGIGVECMFKNESNWLMGISYQWLIGSDVLERNMFDKIVGAEGQVIDQDGLFSEIRLHERGHLGLLQAGKIFPISKLNRNSGVVVQAGIGFMTHRIDIVASTTKVPQITGEYEKGYDRFTGGLALQQFIGYQYLDPKKHVNMKLGLVFNQGFTHSLRDIDFDLGEKNELKRTDLLSGIQFTLMVPIYTKLASEEEFFID